MASGAFDPEAWHDFFIAAAGATAALSGLIFVAVSINLRAILAEEKEIGSSYLTGRALESLAALLVVLGISLVGLDPSIGRDAQPKSLSWSPFSPRTAPPTSPAVSSWPTAATFRPSEARSRSGRHRS